MGSSLISLEEFLALCQAGLRLPLMCELPADLETPLSAYWKLSFQEKYSFLLESVTGGEQLARYSLIGLAPHVVLQTKGSNFRRFSGTVEERGLLQEGQDPLDLLKAELRTLDSVEVPGLPKFFGGAVGLLGYDLVQFFENLPAHNLDDLKADDLAMMVLDQVVVFDHAQNKIKSIVLAEPNETGYHRAIEKQEKVACLLRGPLPSLPVDSFPAREPTADHSSETFQKAVRAVVNLIEQGDGVQMVLSQRWSVPFEAHAISLYRSLRSINPSPYMFLLRFGDYDVVGASPELLVGLEGKTARVRPIAGTRPRGQTPPEDAFLEKELLADEKEIAEHTMLVDLGRNDLGRVCEYGSVRVGELMCVERYSHVMHIVSDVTGTLREGLDAFDLVRACFPAGTVSGAPKIRAMHVIDELEPTRRGFYAGGVGYFGVGGDMDLAITLRSIFLKDGIAYVQAGAGIVHDSNPLKEHQECLNKAGAPLGAIKMALGNRSKGSSKI